MKKSAKPLYMLIFFTSLALIIFSSLMYYAERGTFDPALGVWKRLIEYECQLAVDVLQPPEADVDRDSYFNASQGWLEDLPYNELLGSRCRLDDRAGNATAGSQNFFCMYAYRYKYEGTGVALYEGVDVYYKTRKANCMEFYEVRWTFGPSFAVASCLQGPQSWRCEESFSAVSFITS